jgi:phage N-6-adenine-methyltransferase
MNLRATIAAMLMGCAVLNNSLYASAKSDWETPPAFFNSLNAEFSFTLDACATKSTAKCKMFLSPEVDALSLEWSGIVFLNPPYGRGIGRWIKKARQEASAGRACVVCLVPARTDTKWWHDFCMTADEIRFLTRRLTFAGASNKATFPAAIVIFRGPPTTPTVRAQIVQIHHHSSK